MSHHGLRNFFEKTLLVVFVLSFGLLIFQLGRRYGRRFDLHPSGELFINPTLQAQLKSLKEPLQVYVFYQDISPEIKSARQFLSRCQCVASEQFHVTFIDIVRQPRVVQELEQRLGSLKQDQIIVTYQNQQRVLPLVEGINNHQQIIGTLTNLVCGLSKKILFSTGHGELDPESVHPCFGGSEWKRMLQEKGYQIRKVSLFDEAVNEGELFIIAAPKCDFSESEIAILQKLLQNGSSILLLLSPPYTCGFEPFLRQYGFYIGETLTSSQLAREVRSTNGEFLVNDFGDYPEMQLLKGQSVVLSRSFLLQEISFPHHSIMGLLNATRPGNTTHENAIIALLSHGSHSSTEKLLVVGSADFVENRRFNDLGNPIFSNALVNLLLGENKLPQETISQNAEFVLLNVDYKRIAIGFLLLILGVFCGAWIMRPVQRRR